MEREAPNNAFVIIVFGALGFVLQIAAFVMARRLARAPRPERDAPPLDKEKAAAAAAAGCDTDSDDPASEPPPGWRKKANLRMYTILDKIF